MKGTLNARGWSTGELSPDLFGHTDLNKYQSALKLAKGWIINKRGVLQKCPGTSAVMPCKFPGLKNRLIPFKISFNQQYCLVFGDKYVHFIKNGKPIFTSTEPFQISSFPNSVNPTITLNVGSNDGVSSTNFALGMMFKFRTMADNGIFDFPQSGFILNVKNLWGLISSVTINPTTTTFTVTDLSGNQIDSTLWGAYDNSAGISAVYEVATPYLNTDLSLVKWAQSFDIMQLRHASYTPQQLQHLGDLQWSLTQKYYWPTQQSFASVASGSGGASSGANYYYKVSTYNLQTKQESLPGGIPVGAPTGYGGIYNASGFSSNPDFVSFNIPSVYSGSAGDSVYFNQNIFDTNGRLWIIAYKVYTVKLTQNNGSISLMEIYSENGHPFGQTLVINQGLLFYKGAAPTITISAVTNAFPLQFTASGSIPFLSGDEVMIQNTGIVGIDNNTFTAVKIDSTHFSIQGVDGNNYDLTKFVSNAGSVGNTAVIMASVQPNSTSPITLTFTNLGAPTQNIVFKIYASQARNGPFGFIGFVYPGATGSTATFIDGGIPPDPTLTPKSYIPILFGPNNNPSFCNFYQQRLVEFATNNNPQGLWASVIGDYNDYTVHNPIQESDAIIINVWSNELSQIFDSADAGFMVLMTDLGPLVCQGDSSGDFTPSTDLIRRYAFQGASQTPRPLTIFKNIVYLEANQAAMRDLEILVTPFYTYIDKSNDVSIYSEHLLQQSPISEWDYKLYPDSQIFSVRQDGNMVLTCYFQEQGINGFTWRDTEGKFLNVACVQEGTETTSYVTAQRENGAWIEYFNTPYWTDPTTNAIYTDGTVTYNGQLNDGTTAVLSGGTMFGQSVTAKFNSNTGLSYLPGYLMLFRVNSGTKDTNGNDIWWTARLNIQSNTINSATGTLMEAIQPGILGMTISDIRVCTNVVGGLWNLEGQEVSVVADGFVQSDANNDDTPLVVTNGQIQLTQSFGVVNVGLPYNADFQTLDLDEAKGETYMDKKIGVPRVTMKLLNSGPAFVGPAFTEDLQGYEKMDVNKFREFEGYLSPTNLFTGICELNIDVRYGFGGSFCLRSSAPLPFTILSLAPLVEIQS